MPGTLTSGSEILPRTGAQILAAFADPPTVRLLRTLLSGPHRYRDLLRELDSMPKRALPSRLENLERAGIVVREQRGVLGGSLEYELTEPGRELQFVMISLERWLKASRGEWLQLDSAPAAAAIEALLDAWSSMIARALAAGPHSQVELGEQTAALDGRLVQRCLVEMRDLGLIEEVRVARGEAFYAATDWLRRGAGPIVAASRWEQRNLPEGAPIRRPDAEAALLMTLPLMQLPPTAVGPCRLVVDLPGEAGTVTAVTENLRVKSFTAESRDAEASANGPPSAWFRAAIEAKPDHVEVAGDHRLARGLLDALYAALYSLRAPRISHRL